MMVSEVCPLFPAEGQMVTEAPEETPVETPIETPDETPLGIPVP